MDKKFLDRVVTIMAYLYKNNGEIFNDIGNETCFLYFKGIKQNTLYFEELDCLIYNGIVELDGGNTEEGHETQVYILTPYSKQRIKTILKNNKKLKLNDKTNNP